MKRIITVLGVSSLLLLSSCGSPSSSSASSSSSSEDGISGFTLTPTSTSDSSISNPESRYQVSASQFLAFFYEKLANCTIDVQDSIVRDSDPTTSAVQHDVYHFTTNETRVDYTDAENNKSISTSRYADGYLSKVDRYYDSYEAEYKYPSSLDLASASDLLTNYRKDLLERFFMLFSSTFTAMDYPDSAFKVLLKQIYGHLSYNATDHSYSISESTNSAYGLKSLRLFFNDGNLVRLTSKRRYREFFVGDTTASLTASFSAIGSTVVNLETDIASKYSYHEVTCYSDDGVTLLGKAKAIDGSAPVINFPLAKDPSDSTGAYAFTGWDKDVNDVTADLSVKANFTFVANADLYDFQSGVLSLKTSQVISSLVLPSSFAVNGVDEAVTGFLFGDSGNELSKLKLNPTMSTLSLKNSYLTAKTAVDLNGNPNFKLVGSSLYSADGSTLYRLAESDTSDTTSLPTGLKVIGPYACYDTSSTHVVFPDGLTTIGAYAFAISSLKTLTLPEGVVSVDIKAFQNCDALTAATLPESLVDLPSSLFQKDYSLSSFQGSSKLLSIGNNAFEGTLSLSSFAFPDTLTKVGDSSFSGSGLTSLRLSSLGSAWTSANAAFYGCPFLQNVYFPKGITKIPDRFLDGANSLVSVSFEEGSQIASVGEYAFAYCEALSKIDLSSLASLTSIGPQVFSGDLSLASVALPSSLTSIGESAFAWTSSLKSLVIPSAVTSIKAQAFYGDKALSLYLLATALPSFDTDWNSLDAAAATTVPFYLYSEKTATSPASYWHYVNDVPTAYTA